MKVQSIAKEKERSLRPIRSSAKHSVIFMARCHSICSTLYCKLHMYNPNPLFNISSSRNYFAFSGVRASLPLVLEVDWLDNHFFTSIPYCISRDKKPAQEALLWQFRKADSCSLGISLNSDQLRSISILLPKALKHPHSQLMLPHASLCRLRFPNHVMNFWTRVWSCKPWLKALS